VIACADASIGAELVSWLPGHWHVARSGAVVEIDKPPEGVMLVSDSPVAVEHVREMGWHLGIVVVEPSRLGFLIPPHYDRRVLTLPHTARHLRAAVVTGLIRMAEVDILEAMSERRPRLGPTVKQFVRQLLLEVIPGRSTAIERRRGGVPVYLRTVEGYASAQACSVRHLRSECRRAAGICPSDLRDLVRLRAVLELRVGGAHWGEVAARVGFSRGSAAARFARRTWTHASDLDDERSVLVALAQFAHTLLLGRIPALREAPKVRSG
jgi:AraC-like DNA-binding protein